LVSEEAADRAESAAGHTADRPALDDLAGREEVQVYTSPAEEAVADIPGLVEVP
jgi:hypothetical protein